VRTVLIAAALFAFSALPADVFGARLPVRITRPSPSTASNASVFARIFP